MFLINDPRKCYQRFVHIFKFEAFSTYFLSSRGELIEIIMNVEIY